MSRRAGQHRLGNLVTLPGEGRRAGPSLPGAAERAEDQGDGQSKFFARRRRVKENCGGYCNEWARERFLFICAEPGTSSSAR
jgi:hypothetical protein